MIGYVLDRLAVGSASDALHAPERITAFLNLAEEVDIPVTGATYRKIPLKDFSSISPEDMGEAIRWIKEHIRNHTVLVFCRAGIGRSASIAIAYLCSVGFGYDEALRFVGERKPDLSPVPDLSQSIEECVRFYL